MPQIPRTIARSIAIGNPADGASAARVLRDTTAEPPPSATKSSCRGIRVLAETTGIFTETAGGATVAAALALREAGHLGPRDEVVLCITGNGLKTVEALTPTLIDAPIIAARLRELIHLVDRDAVSTAA